MYKMIVYAFVAIIIGFAVMYYFYGNSLHLKCIVSTIDGNKYCVRDRNKDNEMEAVNLLAKVSKKCDDLVDYVYKKHPDNAFCKQLRKKFNATKIMETLPNSEFTAFSENKGEQISFCLNPEKDRDVNNLIDEHTLTFVAIHELSHVGTKSVGHEDDFWNNFNFLLGEAKSAGIHEPRDYKKTPKKYCSMQINDNPYFK